MLQRKKNRKKRIAWAATQNKCKQKLLEKRITSSTMACICMLVYGITPSAANKLCVECRENVKMHTEWNRIYNIACIFYTLDTAYSTWSLEYSSIIKVFLSQETQMTLKTNWNCANWHYSVATWYNTHTVYTVQFTAQHEKVIALLLPNIRSYCVFRLITSFHYFLICIFNCVR